MKSTKQLVIGEYYAAISGDGRYVFQYPGGNLIGNLPDFIYREKTGFSSGGSGSLNVNDNDAFYRYEPATYDEIECLKQCTLTGRWVPYIKPKHDSYEIY
jgi:hypothetical protein